MNDCIHAWTNEASERVALPEFPMFSIMGKPYNQKATATWGKTMLW